MVRPAFWRRLFGDNRDHGAAPAQVFDSSCFITQSACLSPEQSEQAFYGYLFPGKNEAPLSVPQKLAMECVRDALNKREQRTNLIPRLPTVIPKLLHSLRDPESSARDYYVIVSKDPTLSTAVLKVANSAYFNPTGGYISDIEKAIVKLGISGLRSVLSAAVMQPIVQQESPYFSQTGQRLWQHSLNCAVACELIAQSRAAEPFKVYLLGLMHDLGKITVFTALCKENRLNAEIKPSAQAFVPLIRSISASVSHQIARDWQLPDELCLALQDQIDISPSKPVSPFGKLLYEANIACEAYAVAPRNQRDEYQLLLRDFALPQNLFEKLDEVAQSSR